MSESKWKVGETYRMRNGLEAVIIEKRDGMLFGRRLLSSGIWSGCDWSAETGAFMVGLPSNCDLLPPPAPRIKRTLWLNLYPSGCAHIDIRRDGADMRAGKTRAACVRLKLDFPEGYGVDHDMPPILVRAD